MQNMRLSDSSNEAEYQKMLEHLDQNVHYWVDDRRTDTDDCSAVLNNATTQENCEEQFNAVCMSGKSPCTGVACLYEGTCNIVDTEAECSSLTGFSGEFCEITPCDSVTCVNGGTCSAKVNIYDEGEYECICPAGFSGNLCEVPCEAGFEPNSEDTCVDINECLANPCGSAGCQNSVGSYECLCASGYEKDYVNGWVHHNFCVDIDECARGTSACDVVNGRCHNFSGTYSCICNPGWEKNSYRTRCYDINECTDPRSWIRRSCEAGKTCVNTPGSYSCVTSEVP